MENESSTNLSEIREAISNVQSHELNDHVIMYEQIHTGLEAALRSIDGM